MANTPEADNGFAPREPEEGFEDEAFRHFRQSQERSPYHEMLVTGSPEQVRHAVRMVLSRVEGDVLFEGDAPNSYVMRQYLQDLRERETAIAFTFPLGLSEWPEQLKKEGYQKVRSKREVMVGTLRTCQAEIMARNNLAEKFLEQAAFSADVELYLKDYFTRTGKKLLPSHAYGIILRSPETHEGFVPLGRKVEAVFRLCRQIGEGNAETVEGKKIPNIFGRTVNRGLWEFALNNYILPKLREIRTGSSDSEADGLETYDDRVAANLGLLLFRHWDYDVFYCFGIKGMGQTIANRFQLTEEEMAEINLEIGLGTGDGAKAMWVVPRRVAEWAGGKTEGHRDFPRAAGNPMNLRCLPMLTLPALELISTEYIVDQSIANQIAAKMAARGVVEYKVPNTFSIPVHTYCFGNPVLESLPMDDPRKYRYWINVDTYPRGRGAVDQSGKQVVKKERVEVTFTPGLLGDILWNDAKSVQDWSGGAGDWLVFATGPQTDAFEVPYKLQGNYTLTGFYTEWTRTDLNKQYEEYTQTDKLLKLNKARETALIMLGNALNIRDSTIRKLNYYLTCVQVGTLEAALINEGRNPVLERSCRVPYAARKERQSVHNDIKRAIEVYPCLPLKQNGEIGKTWDDLITKIFYKREAPLPGECEIGVFDPINDKELRREYLFTDDEIAEIKPLYPLGVGR